MENPLCQQSLEVANVQAEDGLIAAETPPPAYEDACYICRMSMAPLLSNDVHTCTQDQLVIASNDQNGPSSSTHPSRFKAEQEINLSQYQRLTRILRTEYCINIPCVYQENTNSASTVINNKSEEEFFTASFLRVSLILTTVLILFVCILCYYFT